MHELPRIDPNRDFKLTLGLVASGTIALATPSLPPNPMLRAIPPGLGLAGCLATIAKKNELDHEDQELKEARDRQAALKSDMDDRIMLASHAFYQTNPSAWVAQKPVPVQWLDQYAQARLNPAPQANFVPVVAAPPLSHSVNAPPVEGTEIHQIETPPLNYDRPALGSFFKTLSTNQGDRPKAPNLFPWELLRDCNLHPHLVVLGASGCGKTSAQEWLARTIGGKKAELLVISTKQKSTQWIGLEVLGLGRNFEEIDPVWNGLEQVLNRRCQDLDLAATQPQILVAIDELNDIVANSSVDVSNLARAGREPGMRLILNSHSEGVDGLGLRGKNDLKSCFTWLRLGKFALQHARLLISKKRLPEPVLLWLESQPFPCMVDDSPACLPDLSPGWQTRLGFLSSTTQNLKPEPPEPPNTQGFEGFQGLTNVEGSSGSEPAEPPQKQLLPAPEPNSTKDDSIEIQFARFKAAGLNKAQIISLLFGVKKGGSERYQLASEFYERLNSNYEGETTNE